jgi:hypothetical protein
MKITELKPRKEKILIFSASILVSFIFIGLLIRNLVEGYRDLEMIGAIMVSVFLVLFISPPLLLSITYFYTDLTKQIRIGENQILVKKGGKLTVISHDDVVDSYYVRTDDIVSYRRYRFPMYRYIVLILKEGRRVFITNLLCEPELVIKTLALDNKIIYTDFPFLKWSIGSGVLTSKEYETKVLEFEKIFREHTNSRLAEIVSQRNVYADYAREAASRILKNRKH